MQSDRENDFFEQGGLGALLRCQRIKVAVSVEADGNVVGVLRLTVGGVSEKIKLYGAVDSDDFILLQNV